MKKEVKNFRCADNSNEPVNVDELLNAENGNAAGQNDLINGKFKSYEDLEVAYNNAQKKLTQTSQKLAELEKAMSNQQLSGIANNKNGSIDPGYLECQKKILLKYLPYCKNKNARSLNEFIAGLPSQLASQFGADLKGLKLAYQSKTKEAAKQKESQDKQAITQSVQEFEQQNMDKLEKPGKKLAFDFYKSFGQFSPEQAMAVLELTDKVISAHEAHKTLNQELNDENNLAKSKLTSSATSSSTPSKEGQHVFTRAEIKEMLRTPAGREKFLNVEKLIFDQMAKGLIK